jgi:enamine deaminase RidA (YjgF/YER057c/UK114 family)
LYISGQVAKDPQGNVVGVGNLEAQTREVCENLSSILKSMGGTFSDVVKINIYTTRVDEIASIRKVGDQCFCLTPCQPARSWALRVSLTKTS